MAYLERRVDVLLPDVERVLGAQITGPVVVRVASAQELTEITSAQSRAFLIAVEGPDVVEQLDEIPTLSRDTLGVVDEDGAIHIREDLLEDADDGGWLWPNWSLRAAPPRAHTLDWVIAHELVHVYQATELGLFAWAKSAAGRSDLDARRAVWEGHATWIAERVMADRDSPADATVEPRFGAFFSFFGDRDPFETPADGAASAFPYRSGERLVADAVDRLGRDEAFRRLFAEPPTMLQVTRPGTWPGPCAHPNGDADARRLRTALALDWKFASWSPYPPTALRPLLAGAPDDLVDPACESVVALHRLRAKRSRRFAPLRGHLIRAEDEDGAVAIARAWVAAAQSRDATESDPDGPYGPTTLSPRWHEYSIEGAPAATSTRVVKNVAWEGRDALVVQRGRRVLELRLHADPSDEEEVRRVARRLLAVLDDDGLPPSADAPRWSSRLRATLAKSARPDDLRPLLRDADADVRCNAVTRLASDGVLTREERERVLGDADALVRLAALAGPREHDRLLRDDLISALQADDAWVVAGAVQFVEVTRAVGLLPPAEVVSLLRHPSVRVRRAASRLLVRAHELTRGRKDAWSSSQLLRALVAALADDDPVARMRAAGELYVVDESAPGLAAAYATAFADERPEIAAAALGGLSHRGSAVPGIVPYLIEALGRPDSAGRIAVRALGETGDAAAAALPVLIERAATAEDTLSRLALETAIARIDQEPTDAIALMRACIRDGTREERQRAAWHAVTLGHAALPLAEDLARLLICDDPSARNAAENALADICRDRQETIRVLDGLRNLDDGAVEEPIDTLIARVKALAEFER